MPDGEILADSGETSESVDELVRGLPSHWPRDNKSGNFALLDVIGHRIDRLDEDLRDATLATKIQTAQSIGELQRLAAPLGLQLKTDETLEHFRARVLAESQIITTEGTAPELIQNAANLLSTNPERIFYDESQTGQILFTVPEPTLQAIGFTDQELANILGRQAPATKKVGITKNGTFTYVSIDTYNAGTFDVDRGYDGLDTNGDPKGNGGTYSGIILAE